MTDGNRVISPDGMAEGKPGGDNTKPASGTAGSERISVLEQGWWKRLRGLAGAKNDHKQRQTGENQRPYV